MPLQIINKWEAQLSFELARPDPLEPEADPKKKPAPPRKPLKPISATPPAPEAPEALQARMEAWLENQRREITTELKTDLYGKIHGTASAKTSVSVMGMVANVSTSGNSSATGLTPLEVDAEENYGQQRFAYLIVKGNPHAAQEFTGSFDAMAPGGQARSTVRGSGGRLTTQSEGEDSEGRRGSNTSTTNTSEAGTPMMVLAHLNVLHAGIWTMSGNVDESFVRKLTQQKGGDIRVIESEWMATLDERDTELEKKVKDFLDEPMPAEPDDNYLKDYMRKFSELRGDPKRMSHYRGQLLAPAMTKLARIRVARARGWANSYPTVEQGATRAVLTAATQRLLTELRQLQLLGVGDCPDLEKAWEKIAEESRNLLKKTLGSKTPPTIGELSEFHTMYVMGEMGTLQEAYVNALNNALNSIGANSNAAPGAAAPP